MAKWQYFLWLLRQAVDGLAYGWPVTVALLCLLAIALVRSRGKPPGRGGWWIQLLPLGVPVVVVALGTVYACENCSPSSLGQGVRHVWAGYLVDGLMLVQLIAAVWLIRIASSRWMVSSALQAIAMWCTFWASLVAGMSISGDWL